MGKSILCSRSSRMLCSSFLSVSFLSVMNLLGQRDSDAKSALIRTTISTIINLTNSVAVGPFEHRLLSRV
ncbi:unnamed protein product [Amoebophrya sp. A25]|nr:unnamed protein product [Amoebophrya sp. A25]|eukprot:GSA25T00010368001.1